MIIIGLLFGIIIIALICQVVVMQVEIKKRRSLAHQTKEYVCEGDLKEYAKVIDIDRIIAIGNRTMDALDAGKIKKQLLHNDAPVYNSKDTVRKYLDFLSSSELSDYIMNIEDGKYNG